MENQENKLEVTESTVEVPKEVAAEDGDNGIEKGALKLAELFWNAQKRLALKTSKRGELSHLYVSTFASWAPQDIIDDIAKQRPFKQVLFALANGLKVVRVVDSGRNLLWRDNRPIPREYIRSSDGDYRYDSRRDRGGHYGDHRDGERRYDDRRNYVDRYDSRSVGGRHYDDRRDGGRHYDDRHHGERRYDDRRHGERRYDDRRDGGRRYDDRRTKGSYEQRADGGHHSVSNRRHQERSDERRRYNSATYPAPNNGWPSLE